MTTWTDIPFLTGERVTKPQLATLLGLTLSELDNAVRQGCPCERTGKLRSELRFNTAQFIAWFTIRAVQNAHGDSAAAMTRLRLENEALEAELARRAA